MRFIPILAVFALAPLLGASERPNVLLLCIDDLRPELGCYGKDYIHSPHIDRLAESGLLFRHHYVQAPTCGASRYALLTGTYDRGRRGNAALFQRAGTLDDPPKQPSLPRHFRDHGYTTVSVGKVSHHPGGRGGADWDDDSKPEIPGAWTRHLQPVGAWKHPRGIMHGLARGEIRLKAGDMALFQAEAGPDSLYPDGLITEAALEQLDALHQKGDPFLLAVGLIRPHLPFGAPQKYLELYEGVELPPTPHPEKPSGKTTWHGSGEFMKYQRWGKDPRKDEAFATEVRRHYAACVSYADAQVGKLLDRLEQLGLEDNTIVLLWGDHGWHLGEHAVWGKHTLFEESLRSPLILRGPGIDRKLSIRDVVETVDVYPTLCDLAGLPSPAFLDGDSLKPKPAGSNAGEGSALSYQGKTSTLRTSRYRLTRHPGGHVELYDHHTPDAETRNIAAEKPQLVEELTRRLEDALKR